MDTKVQKHVPPSCIGAKHFYLLAVLAVGTAIFISRFGHLPALNAVMALATFWLGMVPGYLYLADEDRPPLPLLALTGLYYAVFFGLTAFFFTGEAYHRKIEQTITEPQLLVLSGVALMIGGFYLVQGRFKNILPYLKLPRSYATSHLKLLLWPMVAANFAWHLVPEVQSVPSIGQFVQPVGPLAVGILVLMRRRGDMGRLETTGLSLIILAYLARIIASGLLTELVLFSGFLMVILFYSRMRLFWLWGVAPVILLILVYPALTEFRSQVWFGGQPERSMLDRSALVFQLAARSWTKDAPTTLKWDFSQIVVRTSHISLLSLVVERTPDKVPFLNGRSYRPLFTSFIPRVLWSGKPEEKFGNAFGQRYGILNDWDSWTSINVPWIIEMFVNFGSIGVFAGMAVAGVLLALLSAVFSRREMSDLEFVTGGAIIFPLAYPDSNLSLMTGSLLPLTVCLWIYFRFGLIAANLLDVRVRQILVRAGRLSGRLWKG